MNKVIQFDIQNGGTISINSDSEASSWNLPRLFYRNETLPDLVKGKTVLDFGCGSGILLCVAGMYGAKKLIGIDIEPKYITLTRENLALNSLETPCEIGIGNTFVMKKSVDLVFFNPYQLPLPEKGCLLDEKDFFMGKDGRMLITELLSQFEEWLTPNGMLIMAHHQLSNPEKTKSILSERGYSCATMGEIEYKLVGRMNEETLDYLETFGLDRDTKKQIGNLFFFFKRNCIPENAPFESSEAFLFRRHDNLEKIHRDASAYIYAMLDICDRILTNNLILYFLEGGSLLGAVRDSGIFQYDDDADIQLVPGEERKFEENRSSILKDITEINAICGLNLKLIKATFGYRLVLFPGKNEKFPLVYWESVDEVIPSFAIVDIFFTEYVNNKVEYQDGWTRGKYQNGISKSDITQLKRQSFGPLQMPLPQNPEHAATTQFGEACLKEVVLRNGARFPHVKHSQADYNKSLFQEIYRKYSPYFAAKAHG